MKSLTTLARILIGLVAVLPFFPTIGAHSDNLLIARNERVEHFQQQRGPINTPNVNRPPQNVPNTVRPVENPNVNRAASDANAYRAGAASEANQGNPVIVVPDQNQSAPINPAPYPQ